MSFEVLAIVIGTGTALIMGAIYLLNDDEELDHLDELGVFLAVGGALCLPAGLFYTNALFFSAAGLSGATAILAGRLLIPVLPFAYVGALLAVGAVFAFVLLQGLMALDLSSGSGGQRGAGAVRASAADDIGQDGAKTSVHGTVVDWGAQPVANAQVSLKGPLILAKPALREVATDQSGAYQLDVLSRGTYELKVVADGFEAATQRVRVETGDVDAGALILRQKQRYDLASHILGFDVEELKEEETTDSPAASQPRRSTGEQPSAAPSEAAPNQKRPITRRTATPTSTSRAARSSATQPTATRTPSVIPSSNNGVSPAGPQNAPASTATPRPSSTPTVPPTATSTPVATSTRTPTTVPTSTHTPRPTFTSIPK
ncbi:MAG TPA: carboxypeptidase regulatory-like domain-containing protein [Dehalococcoidia bacterium]|nr:carboxypeptidase regulatory-like domain-containing protein [Dehalococcoidia bacterium]